MQFDLSSALIDKIAFAMENQDDCFRLDSKMCTLISGSDLEEIAPASEDDERFYPIPDWSSADGYNLMLSFTASLRNENAKAVLEGVLQKGKGVFRLFKKELESFPEVERLWHAWRRQEFEKKIRKWYDVLEQSWGALESGVTRDEAFSGNLEDAESSDAAAETLVSEDFVFERFRYTAGDDNGDDEATRRFASIVAEIARLKGAFFLELDECLGETAGKIVSKVFDAATVFTAAPMALAGGSARTENLVVLAKTASGEIAGLIEAAVFSKSEEDAKATALISFLFVQKRFRGLGVAKELLRRLFRNFAEKKIQNAVLFCAIPEKFVPFLLRSHFVRYGSVFFAATIGEENEQQ
ncbi:MAG: hypothetical protein Ta2A_01900 [Treponemataceae bacterium]|nr:MAG: hypothetical protein Ta2A_01900 [Treponemataceae bacterium]